MPDSPWTKIRDLLLNPAKVVFDIGANAGNVTETLRTVFSEATIWSFEPVASTFRELEGRVGGLQNVHVVPLGFGEVPGRHQLFLQHESVWNSLSKNIDRGLGVADAEIETIDRFCGEHSIDHIDVIKTDTEGHDLKVLMGAEETLRRGAVGVIYCEVGFCRPDVGHTYFPDVLEFLQSVDMQFLGLDDNKNIRTVRHRERVSYPWANALFARDDIVQARYGAEFAAWLDRYPLT